MARAKRKNGEGSKTFKHKSGYFKRDVPIGNGKRRSVYGKTDSEVTKKAISLLAQVNEGRATDPSRLTVEQCLRAWLTRKSRHVSERTAELYEHNVEYHIVPVLGKKRVQVLRTKDVRDFMDPFEVRGFSYSVRSQLLGHLRSALQEAVEDGVLLVNPTANVKLARSADERNRRGSDGALTKAEVAKFMKAAKGDRLYALYYLFFAMALRRGEGLGLRWQDVDFSSGRIAVEQQVKVVRNRSTTGALKTRNSVRKLPASSDVMKVLAERKERQAHDKSVAGSAWTESDLVFTTSLGTPVDAHNVNRSMKRIAKKAQIRHVHPHDGRYTKISLLLEAGEDLAVVSAIAGHANPSITLNAYRTVYEDERRNVVLSLSDVLTADDAETDDDTL